MHKWGIHTLGQLAALNKEELRTRLGTQAVCLWERANGTANRPLKFVQPPETFAENYEFDHEIETAEPLLFVLRRFLEQLALRLSSIYLVAHQLTLTITFSNSYQVHYEKDPSDCRNEPGFAGKQTGAGAARTVSLPRRRSDQDLHFAEAGAARTYERVFKIPQPTNDVDLLFRMLQTHLENFKSEHPIVAVALRAEPSRPASQQFGLFETALRNPHQLYETLARLTALVGNDRVGMPILEETHRPDAFRMEAFMWQVGAIDPNRQNNRTASVSSNSSDTTERVPPISKPALRRFRPPARTSIFISEHRHLQSDKIRGQIVDQSGPFLLSGSWWDEKAWARAEWDMELENGDLIRAHESAGIWEIDGIYD